MKLDLSAAENQGVAAGRTGVAMKGRIRTAKLVMDGFETPCVILAMADGQLKAKIFHELPPHRDLALELPDGERFAVVLVWQSGPQAGFFLANEADEKRLLAAVGNERRTGGIRLRTSISALVHTRERPCSTLVTDISQQGAGIMCSSSLRQDEPVRIEARSLGSVTARVRWANHPRYGLAFDEIATLDRLAEIALAAHRKAKAAPRG